MDDCGSLRCVLGDDVEGELVREAEVFVEAEVVELSESLAVLLLLFLSVLRGASLISPASLRWWSSSRPRIRSAYGVLVCVVIRLSGMRASALCVSCEASWKKMAAWSCSSPAVAILLLRVAVCALRTCSWALVRCADSIVHAQEASQHVCPRCGCHC